jgi:hypothetical protein
MKLGTPLLRNAAIGLSQLELPWGQGAQWRPARDVSSSWATSIRAPVGVPRRAQWIPIATLTLLDQADPALLEARLGGRPPPARDPASISGRARGTVAVGLVEPTDTWVVDKSRPARSQCRRTSSRSCALYYLEAV